MQDSLLNNNEHAAPASRSGLADNDDIEDVMLPYSELHVELPLFVELNDEANVAEPTKQDAASAKF